MEESFNNEELLDNVVIQSDGPDFISISKSKFIILNVLTLNIYCIWWMYKVWKFFKERQVLDIIPAARAIFAIFFIYSLFEKIKAFAFKFGYKKDYSSEALFALWLVGSILGNFDQWWSLFTIFVFYAFLQPLESLNQAFENSDVDSHHIPENFNGKQIGLIIFGLLLWALVLIGLFVPDDFDTYDY